MIQIPKIFGHYSFLGGTSDKGTCLPMQETWDSGSIPGLGNASGGQHGNLLQYSCVENSMDKGSGGLQSMEWLRVQQDWSELEHKAHIICSSEDII